MKLYFMEVRKLCDKKIVWIGVAATMLFFAFQFWAASIETIRIYENGEWITGMEAIERNKEIAKEYEGILTIEKAETIIQKYGFSYYDEATDYETGNYSNRFITHIMTDLRYTGERPTEFVKGEDGSYQGAHYLEGDIVFGYAEGWGNLRESMVVYMVMISILSIIITAPVFTEEYALRTADVALTTRHGRKRDIWLKIGAALGVIAVIYMIAVGSMYGAYLCVYGTESLSAGAYMLCPLNTCREITIFQFYLRYFFIGLAAVLLNTAITLAISAVFKQGFITIIVSLTVYLLPYVLSEIIMELLPVSRISFILKNIFTWFPFWLANSLQFGTVPWLHMWKLLFVSAMFLASVIFAYRKYRN